MTSSPLSNHFRVALLRVARHMTYENVQQLAFLCVQIPPSKRRELKDAMDLFDQLEEHGVLHEKNVSILIEWLDELQLQQALKPLMTYKHVHLDDNLEVTQKCFTHGEKLTTFCITCNSKLCQKCYNRSHNFSCKVIELDKLPREMESCKAKLKKDLELLQKLSDTSENLTRSMHTGHRESAGKIAAFTNPGKLALNLIKGLHHWKQPKYSLQPVSDESETPKGGNESQDLRGPTIDHQSKSRNSEINGRGGTFQQDQEGVKVNEAVEAKVRDTTAEWYEELSRDNLCGLSKDGDIEWYAELSKESNCGLRNVGDSKEWYAEVSRDSSCGASKDGDGYRELCRENTFGTPSVRCFVGGVMIRENQLVHVYNEIQRRSGVLFLCIDPNDTHIEYWRYLVAVNDNQISPVVMSHKEMKYGGINHVLFAVGNMVFILHPRRKSGMYDAVQSVASISIDEVGERSFITSIAAHRLHYECDEFLISISGSTVLREYQISGRPLRRIGTTCQAPSFSSISYVENMFAVRGSQNVVSIFRTDAATQQSSILHPVSDSGRLLPVSVIWTGDAGWMVLFVSNTRDKLDWMISCYDEAGELLKVCVQGTSPGYKGVPVSITRWANTGFISFSDSSVKAFKY